MSKIIMPQGWCFLLFISIVVLSNPSYENSLVNKDKIRLSILYKDILNLSDIKYITSIIKNKNILAKLFTNRKITKAGRIYIKSILFDDFDIKKLDLSKRFWNKIVPYLDDEELKLVIANLDKLEIGTQLFIVEQITNRFCNRFTLSMSRYIFLKYYKHSDFIDIIIKCKNHILLAVYTNAFLHKRISIRTYLYLISEYKFSDIKKYLYKIMPGLLYTSLQLIFIHYPNVIDYMVKNLYSKFLIDYTLYKRKKFNVIPKKIYKLSYYVLIKNIIGNIYYSKNMKKVLKLNTDFFTLFWLIKKHPDYLLYVYKEDIKNESFRFKVFLIFVDMRKLSDFYVLKSFYKPYEIYTYIKKVKYLGRSIRYICSCMKSFFGDKHNKLWKRVCR